MQDFVAVGRDIHVAQLWDGYGTIVRRRYKHLLAEPPRFLHTVVKTIKLPAKKSKPSQSSTRKLISYAVERFFYSWLENSSIMFPYSFRTAKIYDIGDEYLILEDLVAAGYARSFDSALSDTREIYAVLKWLAEFHAYFWGIQVGATPQTMESSFKCADGVWETGSYWYLATRQSEFESLTSEWKALGLKVDELIEAIPDKFKTVIHGDAKTENCLINETGDVALYDFQYVGYGSGMKDVLSKKDQLGCRILEEYSFEIMKYHYELCLIDWLRFIKGWGLWGDHKFVEQKVDKIKWKF
ncbi:hypothetical protein HK100_001143 [Physocladia obscura]|uniref:CHK kinase-like domain-containing protein n=1 Tax=Physocladia obscura TaxID=109957 RepID=A0AAD5SXF1_9FUNG|nr:hypothetical protein HK100_001143 [Physocladia obscura]